MSLNIHQQANDEFYRYKIPKIETRLLGKGNGKRTILINIVSIAKALDRPVLYLIKFFCYDLGTQFKLDKNNKLYMLNGVQDSEKLEKLIFDFIRDYILCRHCNNPETIFKIKINKRIIKCLCIACGNFFEINESNKLGNFIIKDYMNMIKKIK